MLYHYSIDFVDFPPLKIDSHPSKKIVLFASIEAL